MRIAEDISVAGFNDSEATLMYPQLTSVREFPEEMKGAIWLSSY